MPDAKETQIFLTDLFLDNGNSVPFIILEHEVTEQRFDCLIVVGLYFTVDKKIEYTHCRRNLLGKDIIQSVKGEALKIAEFYIKKELATFIEEKTDAAIDNKFKLIPCSLELFYTFTFADMPKTEAHKNTTIFSHFSELQTPVRMLLDAGCFNHLENTWETL